MQSKNGQESMIDGIMQRIREEVASRKMEAASQAQDSKETSQTFEAHTPSN